MRHDLTSDERSCLGCGRQCSDPYSFCGRCLSNSYSAARPGLSNRMRNIIFWIVAIGAAVLAWWTSTGFNR
jgi:hypothetical protein